MSTADAFIKVQSKMKFQACSYIRMYIHKYYDCWLHDTGIYFVDVTMHAKGVTPISYHTK